MEIEKRGSLKNVVIIILVLVIAALVGIYFLVLKEKNHCDVIANTDSKTYYCEKAVSDILLDGVSTSVKEKIMYDDTGEIISTKVITVYKYNDKEKYMEVKETQGGQDAKNNYIFDDDNMIMEVEPKTSNVLKNQAGEAVSIWYKEYIKSFQNEGYTCIKK